MNPERAALTTLRAQLGYAGKLLDEKQGDVLNCEAKLARAQDERDDAQQRYTDYWEAIRILEQAGYGNEQP